MYYEDPLRGFQSVLDDDVFREMSRTREEAGYKHIKGFVQEDIHTTVQHQRQMFSRESGSISDTAKPPGRKLCLRFCLGQWWKDEFLRYPDCPGVIF